MTSQRDLVLSSHNSAKSSEASSIRCKANEQITISMRIFGASGIMSCAFALRGRQSTRGSGGKAPLAMSRNDSDAHGCDVLSK